MTPWRTISVALTANVAGYQRGLGQAAAATAAFDKQTEASMARVGARWETVGKIAAAGLLAMAVATGASVREAISWESAFAGVQKTVDATEAEFAALADGIINMANRLPASREEIAGVAEAAGQLGIATPNILSFSETMIGLGEATNLSAADAATQLARLANITQMSQADFDRLGSSVVALGNNFATTEAEIVGMALRIAAAGNQIGLTEDEIVAMAAALSSVGIEAEAGGTAISRIMIDMAQAVDLGSDKLETMAMVAGMSSDAFADLFQQDASAALNSFVVGLGTAEDRGVSLFGVLQDLGFADVRVRNALISMASSGDLLSEALDLSATAWEENNALADEVAQRYATAESQLRIFANQATNVARIVGAELVPFLLGAVDAIREFARWIADIGSTDQAQAIFAALADTGANVVDTLRAMWDAGAPIVELLAALAGTAVVGGLTLIAGSLEAVTGFLADAEWATYALVAALTTLAAVRAFEGLTRGADMFLDHLSNMSEFAAQSGRLTALGTSVRSIGAGLGQMGAAGAGAFRNLDNYTGQWSSGLATARTGVTGLARAIGPLGIAVLAVGATAAVGFALFGDRAKEARRDIEALTKGVDTSSSVDEIYRMERQLRSLSDESYSVASQLAGVFGGSRSDEFAAGADEMGDAADRLVAKYREVAEVLDGGMTWRGVEAVAMANDIDAAGLSAAELADQIASASRTASAATPQLMSMGEAAAVLGDETADAADRAEALKKALDSILTVPLNLWDAETSLATGVNDLNAAVAEHGLVLDQWTESGSAVRDALSGAVTEAQALANARIDDGWDVDRAIAPLRQLGDMIAQMGRDAGLSSVEVRQLLADLGLTEADFTAVIMTETGEASAAVAAVRSDLEVLDGSTWQAHLDVDDESVARKMDNVEALLDNWIRRDPTALAFLDISDPIERVAEARALVDHWATTDVAAIAYLDTLPVEERVRFLEAEAARLAALDPTITADVDVDSAEGALDWLGRDRDVHLRVQVSHADLDQARALFDANRAVADAERSVADATSELAAARRAAAGDSDEFRRAQQGIVDAERNLAAAQRESRAAQEDLTRAREEAANAMIRLEFGAEGAALSEQAARFSLEDAQRALREASPDERSRAALRVAQADLALREAIQRRIDSEEELSDAQRRGIEGSDQVVAARSRIQSAAENERDAHQRLSEAHDAAATVQVQAADRVRAATDTLAERKLALIDAESVLIAQNSDTAESLDGLIGKFRATADELDATSPLRRNLEDYIADLVRLRDLQEQSRPGFMEMARGLFGGGGGGSFNWSNPTMPFFAAGGVTGSGASVAGLYQPTPGGRYRFAESSTGGELLLPMQGISAARARALLDIGAGRYGFTIVDKRVPGFAAGGITYRPPATSPVPHQAAPVVNVTVADGSGGVVFEEGSFTFSGDSPRHTATLVRDALNGIMS